MIDPPTLEKRHDWLEEAQRLAAIDGNEDIKIKARWLVFWLSELDSLENEIAVDHKEIATRLDKVEAAVRSYG